MKFLSEELCISELATKDFTGVLVFEPYLLLTREALEERDLPVEADLS